MSLAIGAVDDRVWDDFCAASPSTWWWHTVAFREYTIAYRPELHSESLAFGIWDDRDLAAIVPLMVEQPGDGPTFTFGGGSCWAPALAPGLEPAHAERVLRLAFEHVEELAAEYHAQRTAFALSPLLSDLSTTSLWWTAATIRAGYLDASLLSQVIHLATDDDQLLRSMTKGHRAAVKRAQKSIAVDAITGSRADIGDVFAAYQEMHRRAAGRTTRPQRTFDIMLEWLRNGDAVLFGARFDDRYIGFALVNRYRSGAYYGSAANDPDEAGQPVGHAVQWKAMTWLRDQGVTTYELGAQPFANLPHDEASDKELAIARFKRGFGGVAVPMLVRERFWSASALASVRARLDRFSTRPTDDAP